jgi:membrane-associated phospholipid phosphatase
MALRPVTAAAVILCCAAPVVRASDVPTLSEQAAAHVAAASPSDYDFAPELGGDGRRTTGRFVKNLGRNVVGVFSKDNLAPFLAGAALTGAATAFDTGTQNLIKGQVEDLGEIGGSAGTLSTIAPLAVGLFVGGRASGDSRFRAATYDIAQATLVTGLYTGILKAATGRQRPDGSDNKSFPSGHTSNAFAWATVANHHYGPKVGVPAYAIAGLIGASRIESNKHHLSDVVAGAALGLIVGRTVAREDGELVRQQRRLSIVPMTDAQGGGVGAGVSYQF